MAGSMTDVTGYRGDSRSVGASNTRNAIAEQIGSLVTDKLPLLNGPGAKIEDSLYYNITNSTVTAVELQESFQKDRISFNNPNFGGSPTAYIPSVLFANTAFVQMTLKDVKWGSNDLATEHFHMPRGWGFAAINSIIVYMGASSIAQIQLSGESNYLIMMATCETENKRSHMLDAAGRYLNSQDSASIMADYSKEKSIFRRRNTELPNQSIYSSEILSGNAGNLAASTDASELRNALVPIRLPWSSMIALEKRISMDTKLFTQPIQLTLNLKQEVELMNAPVSITNQLRSFSSLSLQLWQEELSDKSFSIRQELLRSPAYNVGYPFQYAQSVDFSIPKTSTRSTFDGMQDVRMNITSLINSDLTTMLFYVRNQTSSSSGNNYIPLGATGDAQFTTRDFSNGTWTYGEELLYPELKLNGQRMFAFDGNTYNAASLAKQMDHTTCKVERPVIYIPPNNTNSQQFFGSVDSEGTINAWGKTPDYLYTNIYELNFGKIRSIVAEAHMQNTGRFTNQTFQLAFSINKNKGSNFTTPPEALENYRLYMTYLYNAVFLIGGDGGTTKLITN